MSSRLDDIKASRPGVAVRVWIDGKPVQVVGQAYESAGKADLDWLIAEVERLTAERDAAIQRAESLAIQLQACQDALTETIHDAGENGRERDAALQRAETAERELAARRSPHV